MARQKVYFCIDMKTFYASVECAERGVNPFETNLVVADVTRGKNALCLAISPKLKAQGIRNRCRLSEIPPSIKYEIAPPRMALYIQYSADIYDLYLDYFSPDDIHVYSIDESFIDVSDYMPFFKLPPKELAKMLIDEIAYKKHIPSTAGIGTNMYLAKIALDITAKHSPEHIGYLDEKLYMRQLWGHRPITDFWQISTGTERRLAKYGIYDMRGIVNAPEDLLYKEFGVNAELLIDHAWGRESCTIADIKQYKSKSKSVSFSQILPRDYSFSEARTVMIEMAQNGSMELMKRHLITSKVSIFVGYSRERHPATAGAVKIRLATARNSVLEPAIVAIFDSTTDRQTPIRRLGLCFEKVADEGCEGYDLFTDFEAVEREKRRDRTVLELKEKYGKNAVLRGTNLLDAGTQRERNNMIGGHRAGYDSTGKS